MPEITLRVLDGADRGRCFDHLRPPVTIGREEGNSVRLNDDRISRFHVKLQEDDGQIVLTDLESTNGTRVNGEDVHLRMLRAGDLITVGRTVLLFGSRDEIAERLADLRGDLQQTQMHELDTEDAERLERASSLDFELNYGDDQDLQATLHVLQPPSLPSRLTPGQAAQLSELLEYIHLRIRRLLATAKVDGKQRQVTLDQRQWQNLIDLQDRLAGYLRQIGEPNDS